MNPQLKLVAEQQSGVFSRQQAIAGGYTPGQIRRRLADGRWVRIRHGQYGERLDLSALPPWEQARQHHRRLVHAVMQSWRAGAIAVSHQSALALHGLPLWGLDLGQVHVTRLDERAGGVIAGVRHHVGQLAPVDLIEADGLVTTTVARGVLERLRVLMHTYGLPTPAPQVEFHDADGLIGRVDFYFPQYDTVVELDGRMKYGGGSADVLVREKVREDRLRALGLQVVRADWTDFDRPRRLVAGINQAFTRARPAA